MRTQDGVFVELSSAWQFPDYFGWNRAALDECINDLEWVAWIGGSRGAPEHPDAFVTLVTGAEELLMHEHEPAFAALIEIFHDAGEQWSHRTESGSLLGARERARGFHVVLQVAPGRRGAMLKRLERACEEYPHIVFDEIASGDD